MSGKATPRRRGALGNATSARRCCSGWTNPQQWLMLAMFLLALFIFGIRFQQSQNILPQSDRPSIVRKEWLRGGESQEDVDLDEWLGSSRKEPEVGLLSQKLLRKLGLDGAGKSDAMDTKTSADDSADDEPGGQPLLESDALPDAIARSQRSQQRRHRRQHAKQPLRPSARRGPYGKAAAVIRERALGAVTGSADFHADVTTEQQKALSGVTKLGRQDWVNARLNRRAGQSKEATDSGNSAVSDVALEVTEDHFNSSAQFLEPGKAKSQADPITAAKTAAVRNTGGLLKQVATEGLAGDSAMGSNAGGAQWAAQKFKLSSGKMEKVKAGAQHVTGSREEQDELELPNFHKQKRGGGMPLLGQKMATVGIDEVVAHSDRPDYVASKDPELRMWDALDAGTHDGTLQDAMLEHMQVDETIGFADDEDPSDGLVSDRRDEGLYLDDVLEKDGAMVEGQPKLDESYADVRVVGGENSLEERPLTEGLELFGTGVEPVKEPPPAAKADTVDEKKDATEKGEDKGPYAQDLTDGSEQVTGSAEGGRGVWGWLKGLSGADKDEKSAHQIYKETTGELRGQAGFSGQLNVGEGASS